MTNDELWIRAIAVQSAIVERDGTVIDHTMNMRIKASVAEHEQARVIYRASHSRLMAMRQAAAIDEDYLLWKLAYDQR